MCVCVSCSVISDTTTPWTVACQDPPSGILQARILEWVAISFSRGFSWPRDRTWVSHIAYRLFTIWATREDCSFLFSVWEGASLWAHSVHSFHMPLGYVGQILFSCLHFLVWCLLLAFPQLLSNHHEGWQDPLDLSFGSRCSHLEARNHWWLWHFLFIDMAGDIFISQRTWQPTPVY